MNTDFVSYYKSRAIEYEDIYSKPERQTNLTLIRKIFQEFFSAKEVLEIACGTGYWTEVISKTAKSVLATDINETVIDVAKTKSFKKSNVQFQIHDLFELPANERHECLFGGFIWSHIKLEELENFIAVVTKLVRSGEDVFH